MKARPSPVAAVDHGVVVEDLSAYPQSVIVRMLEKFQSGGAAISAFARQAGLVIRPSGQEWKGDRRNSSMMINVAMFTNPSLAFPACRYWGILIRRGQTTMTAPSAVEKSSYLSRNFLRPLGGGTLLPSAG